MRIALLPTTGTSFPALQMLQPAHRFQELPVPGHLARLAASPNRLVPKQLPEVAGERRVEAQLSHKLAESLPVRDRVDPELRRHQTLHGAAELASDRSRCPGKNSRLILRWCQRVSSHTSLVPDHFFKITAMLSETRPDLRTTFVFAI